jgi:3-deoxy-D-manno-octulosonic-acid transferase
MDSIEKSLFGREYPRLFDLITVQDDATRDTIVAAGADPQRVFVAGNIKFDAVGAPGWSPGQSRSPVLLRNIVGGGRPTIVAGCVTNISEQTLTLDAFGAVLRQMPDALLVLAPRHPEVQERMEKLRVLLTERGLRFALKSAGGDAPVARDLNCLVLDTMGELKDFYAASTISYVGLNHNVLEPMSFGKPVIVTPGWDPVYPSFPVYQRLLGEGAIRQVENHELGGAWLELLQDRDAHADRERKVRKTLESLEGATSRNAELLARFGLIRLEPISDTKCGS